jgi:hypothetical protein
MTVTDSSGVEAGPTAVAPGDRRSGARPDRAGRPLANEHRLPAGGRAPIRAGEAPLQTDTEAEP